MVISPSSSYPFRLPVVGNHIAVFGKFLVADGAFAALLSNFLVQQLAHLGGGAKLSVPSRVVWVFDALDAKPQSPFPLGLLPATAE